MGTPFSFDEIDCLLTWFDLSQSSFRDQEFIRLFGPEHPYSSFFPDPLE